MSFLAAKTLSTIATFVLITQAFVYAECPVDQIIVNGRVHHASSSATVRVQLVYPHGIPGDAGEVTAGNGEFSVPVDFLTQSRRPLINGAFEKCNRRPMSVIVTLVDGDGEQGRISLDFAKDFRMADSSTYILKSAIALEGTH